MKQHILIFSRISDSSIENCISVTIWMNDNDACPLKALKQGLSQWASNTEIGKEAWENSGEDFNIGDLGSYDPEYSSYLPFLTKAGISGIRFDDVSLNVNYDHILIDIPVDEQ